MLVKGGPVVQVMACRLFGTKPFPKPMLASSIGPLGNWTLSEIRTEIQNFSFMKMRLKLPSVVTILSGGDELIVYDELFMLFTFTFYVIYMLFYTVGLSFWGMISVI